MTTNRDRISDAYDLSAYDQMLKELSRVPGPIKKLSTKTSDAIGAKGKNLYQRLPEGATDVLSKAMKKSFEGFHKLLSEPSFRSIVRSRVEARYRNLGYAITSLEQIRDLPLKTIDIATPPLRFNYAATMALEGAVAGAAVTGAGALAIFGTTASMGVAAAPSLGLVASAIAADTAAVLAASMRVIAHEGAYFGHDLRLPEEQAFALAIISWSDAGNSIAKAQAFQELSKVTQHLVRNATRKVLSEHAVVAAVEKMAASIGFKITKKKLGQAIPAIGIVIGAGLNAQILHSVAKDAQVAYRLRHLMQKYDLNPAEFGGLAIKAGDTFEETFPDSTDDDEDPLT